MVKEPKNIDFYTSGRKPTKDEFKRISDWILKRKQKKANSKKSINQQKSERKIVFEIKN